MHIAPLDYDRMFGALADATRRDIARRAIEGNEGVAELADHYPMSFAAVQKHIAILERAHLITNDYHLSPEDTEAPSMTLAAEFDAPRSGSGSSGTTLASWSDGGDRRLIPPR
jgi:hypothetical protein